MTLVRLLTCVYALHTQTLIHHHWLLFGVCVCVCVCVCVQGRYTKFWTLFTHVVFWSLSTFVAFHSSIRLGPAQLCTQWCRALFTSEAIPIMKFGRLRSETHPTYRFLGSPLRSFCVIVLTNQRRDLGENRTCLAELKIIHQI